HVVNTTMACDRRRNPWDWYLFSRYPHASAGDTPWIPAKIPTSLVDLCWRTSRRSEPEHVPPSLACMRGSMRNSAPAVVGRTSGGIICMSPRLKPRRSTHEHAGRGTDRAHIGLF